MFLVLIVQTRTTFFSLYDSDGELDILTLNHFCGEVTETLSDGDASDLCDLQAIIHKRKRNVLKKLSYSMKGIFWNCNGLGDPNKFKFLSDVVCEKKFRFYYSIIY
jgi:hypothetical protein